MRKVKLTQNKDSIMGVVEIKELDNFIEANKYLSDENEKWVLLEVFIDTQLCFQRIIVQPSNFEKVQPFDKIFKLYVIGRVEGK